MLISPSWCHMLFSTYFLIHILSWESKKKLHIRQQWNFDFVQFNVLRKSWDSLWDDKIFELGGSKDFSMLYAVAKSNILLSIQILYNCNFPWNEIIPAVLWRDKVTYELCISVGQLSQEWCLNTVIKSRHCKSKDLCMYIYIYIYTHIYMGAWGSVVVKALR